MTDINHALAEQVLDKIRSYPENFSMAAWFSHSFEYNDELDDELDDFEEGCGTTLCMAGWVDWLTTKRVRVWDIDSRTGMALGLTPENWNMVFHVTDSCAIELLELMAKPDSTNRDVTTLLYKSKLQVTAGIGYFIA